MACNPIDIGYRSAQVEGRRQVTLFLCLPHEQESVGRRRILGRRLLVVRTGTYSHKVRNSFIAAQRIFVVAFKKSAMLVPSPTAPIRTKKEYFVRKADVSNEKRYAENRRI